MELAPEGPLKELNRYVQLVNGKEYVKSSKRSIFMYEKGLEQTLQALKAQLEQENDQSKQVCEPMFFICALTYIAPRNDRCSNMGSRIW